MFGIAAAAALVVGCSDSSSPSGGTTLSTQQKAVLTNALTDIDASTGAGVGAYGALALQFTGSVGKLDAGTAGVIDGAVNASLMGLRATGYEGAVGLRIIISDATTPANSATLTGVIGWAGLNSQAQTVDEVVFASVVTEGTATPPGNGTYSFASTSSPYGFGIYFNRATASAYFASSGSLVMSGASFTGNGTNCSQQGITCNYKLGTLSGNFAFGAELIDGTGPATYTQSAVHFTSVPAVQITLSGFLGTATALR